MYVLDTCSHEHDIDAVQLCRNTMFDQDVRSSTTSTSNEQLLCIRLKMCHCDEHIASAHCCSLSAYTLLDLPVRNGLHE